jgi:MFS family permease
MHLADYVAFASRHRRFLAFGFLLTFTSSAGQTFFIGLFGPAVRSTFDLSHTEWGSLYLVGTLASAFILPWTGQLIDRLDLRLFVAMTLAGLALACLAMSMASSIVILAVAIFLLRQTGQGLTSHAAATTMARYHGSDRGKALAIASVGMAVAEAMLPLRSRNRADETAVSRPGRGQAATISTSAAQQAAGAGHRVGIPLAGPHPVDPGAHIAGGRLQQADAARRKIPVDLELTQRQTGKIDDVDVCALAGFQ